MDTTPFLLILSSTILILLTTPTHSTTPTQCKPEFCDERTGPLIRFPFRLNRQNPVRCGYPGFDLHCDSNNQTILTLPQSGEFIVDYIDYNRQSLFINDPYNCLPSRIMNLSLSGSPFVNDNMREYTFMNCTSPDNDTDSSLNMAVPLYCMSGRNYTVVAVSTHAAGRDIPVGCRSIGEVLVPAVSVFYWPMDMRQDLDLVWRDPECWECENSGGVCGFRSDSGLDIGCSLPSRRGLPRSAKYGVIIGIGIPGLLCLIGLIRYGFGMIKAASMRRRLNSVLPTTIAASELRLTNRSTSGLDGATIESYPKTVLGESKRLPKPCDTTCPICLSDYQAKETIKSIPECNHYFHAHCIDEWLKLNGSCPLCRNLPESPSATPSSSMPTTSPDDR